MTHIEINKVRKCITSIGYHSDHLNKRIGAIVKDIDTERNLLYIVNSLTACWLPFVKVENISY